MGLIQLIIMTCAYAQENNINYDYEHEDRHFVLDTILNNNKSHHYAATDSITLLPGFSYDPMEEKRLELVINPLMIFPPSEGITGGPFAGDDGVVGTIGGSVSVGALGAAVYTIPIEVPAGINGMQPQLAITYNSQAGNGLLGWGWNLSGVSAITRTNSTKYYDSKNKEVNFNNDALMLDGQRLIKVSDNGNVIEYKAEQDDFSKILFHIENNKHIKCEIWKDNGLVYYYGFTEDSKLMTANEEHVIKWMIGSIEDRNGNKIIYHYNTNNNTGECYTDKIEYTHNDDENITPMFQIKFRYHDVEDREYSYVAGNMIRDRMILDSISILKDNGINYASYTFNYKESYEGKWYDSIRVYSRLTSIGYVKNNMKFNQTRISWNGDCCDNVFTNNVLVNNIHGTIYEDFIFVGDFNGDGYSDILTVPFKENEEYTDSISMNVHLNNREGGFNNQAATSLQLPKTLEWVHVLDFNDDMLDDIIVHLHDSINNDITTFLVYENKKELGFNLELSQIYNSKVIVLKGDYIGDGKGCASLFPFDINNDTITISKMDIIHYANNTYNICRLSLPSSTRHVVNGDFTGDGKDDILFVKDNSSSVYSISSHGSADGFFSTYEISHIYDTDKMIYNHNKWNYFFPGDINGDGKTDILYYDHYKISGSKGNIFFSTGVDFEMVNCNYLNNTHLPEYNLYSYSLSRVEKDPRYGLTLSDFDGDGKTDLALFYHSENAPTHISFYMNYNIDSKKFLSPYYPSFHSSQIGNIDCKSQYFNVGNFIGKDNVSCFTLRRDNHNHTIIKPMIFSLKPISELYSVKNITDGMGNSTSFTYSHLMLSNDDIYKSTNDEYQYGIRALPIPLYTLKSVITSNSGNGLEKSFYKYCNTLYHKNGHGLIGFDKITVTKYNNDSISEIKVSLFETETMNHNALLLPSCDSTYLYNNGKKILSEVNKYHFDNVKYDYPSSNANKVIRPAMRKNITEHFDIDKPNLLLYKTITEYTYNYSDDKKYVDTYHCIETKIGTDEDDISESSTATFLTKENVYFYNNDIQNWIVNRTNTTITTCSFKDKPDIMTKAKYEYSTENPYLITKITEIPSEDDNDPLTICRQMSYDELGNMIKETITAPYGNNNEQGLETDYEYHENRIIKKISVDKNGLNYSESYSYDNYDRLASHVDCANLTTTYNTDYANNIITTISPNNVETVDAIRWAVDNESAPDNALYYKWSKTKGGNTSVTFYHKTGAELRTISHDHKRNPIIVDKEYDGNGRLERVSNPYRKGENILWTRYNYDKFGRIINTISPDNTVTRHFYDGFDYTTTIYSETSARSSTQRMNPMGWIIENTDNDRNSIKYDHYSDGNIASISPQGNTFQIELRYDNAGNRIYLKDPDYGTTTSKYDAYGRLLSQTTPKGDSTSYSYDILNRLTRQIDHAENISTSYIYDNSQERKGTISKITHNNQEITYEYDDFLRPTSICEKIGDNSYVTEISYDELSRISGKTYPSGYTVNYDYYNSGILRSIRDDNDNVLWRTDEINAMGQIVKCTNGSGIVTNYTYDAKGQLLSNVTSNNINNFSYTYDKFGNLASRKDNIVFNMTEFFGYDRLDRLTNTSIGDNGSVMKYDKYGRIIMKQQNGDTIFHDSKFNINDKPHALISSNINPDYFSSSTQNVEYTSFNKVRRITENNKTISFSYGYNNQRIEMSETVDGKQRNKTYVGDCEFVTDNGLATTRTYLSSPYGVFAVVVSTNGNDAVYYVYKDHIGSWTSITDSEGNVRQKLRYDAWGKIIHIENLIGGTVEKPMFDRGFTGHEHHCDFNLINMNGRMYDPVMSSFLSPDNYVQEPVSLQSLNRYAYCLYNPLRYIDPSGYRITDPPHTNVVINYVTSEGDVSNDLKRLLNFYGITDVTHATSDGYSGGTIRWSEGNYEYTYSYGGDINEGTLSCQYVGDYNINYNYPSFNTSESSYSIPQPNLPGNGGGCAAGIATATGTGASIGAEMFYSKTYKTWMGKNWKMYKQTWNGNQHVGGKLSYGKRNSDVLRKVGYVSSALNEGILIYEYLNDDISTFELYIESLSLSFSTFGGPWGIAWGVGWELGRIITFTEAYQEFKFNLHYNMYENKFGAPSESNEYLWYDFYKNYQP